MSSITVPNTGSTTSSGTINSIPEYKTGGPTYVDKNKSAEELQTNFINLLTAQLQYQDPMKPMENAEVTSQMAQLSTLQQSSQTNTLLQQLVDAQSTTGINQGVSYLGKNIVVEGDRFSMKDGKGSLGFELSLPANASITVFDQYGQKVKWIDPAKYAAGESNVNVNDSSLGDGIYRFEVSLMDANAEETKVTPLGGGTVSGVSNDASKGVMLEMNGMKVAMDKVRRITT
ncbi:MAG: hypothetical protein HQL51_00400 [Magnetococcales bacterium]|nr:hypothetical protein [Magnetococcales bacterium]